ncbi:alpha-N-acetylgalactosaminidase-like [Pomacea canaliculata]|nr:alpha-N-acetylgalactosaminidase-like [Pomacea canaliculata]
MGLSVLLCLVAIISFGHALDNGLGLTPPMGWLSWQRYRCQLDCQNAPTECVSENLYKAMAERMVLDGYRDAGYVYVNIDDCWPEKQRDEQGRLVGDKVRFPSGMKALADFMHERGLKLGIYSDMGYDTCAGYPGSKFYMEMDAQTFAEWGIDSLKLDGCYSSLDDFAIGYPTMGFFLNKTGRPILYSCSWPAYIVGNKQTPDYQLIAKYCNLWRNYLDIDDSWESVSNIIEWFAQDNGNLSAAAGPGHFNDPDMLVIGDYGLSYDQQRVQMAMWAIMAAPLYMSNDLRNIRPESRELLLNKRIIAINQDPLGIQGQRLYKAGNIEFWSRPIVPQGSFAFAVVNFSAAGGPAFLDLSLSNFAASFSSIYNVTEAFDGTPVGILKPNTTFRVSVNPSGVFMAVAIPV